MRAASSGSTHGPGWLRAIRHREAFKGRHADIVGINGIESPVAAIADIGLRVGKESFRPLDACELLLRCLGHFVKVGRQSFALVGTEHGVLFEVGDLLLGLGAIFGLLGLLERVGIHDR